MLFSELLLPFEHEKYIANQAKCACSKKKLDVKNCVFVFPANTSTFHSPSGRNKSLLSVLFLEKGYLK